MVVEEMAYMLELLVDLVAVQEEEMVMETELLDKDIVVEVLNI